MKAWHVSWDPLELLTNQPMWFWLDKKYATSLKNNIKEYDNVDAVIYEANIVLNIARIEEVEHLFKQSGLDIYDYEAMLTENPEPEDIWNMLGTRLLLKKGYEGIIHYDYDPGTHGDAESLLVFDPKKIIVKPLQEGIMKITKRRLKRIIREEYSKLVESMNPEAILHNAIENGYQEELVEILLNTIERNNLDPEIALNIISNTGALSPDQFEELEDILGLSEELAWTDEEPMDYRPIF